MTNPFKATLQTTICYFFCSLVPNLVLSLTCSLSRDGSLWIFQRRGLSWIMDGPSFLTATHPLRYELLCGMWGHVPECYMFSVFSISIQFEASFRPQPVSVPGCVFSVKWTRPEEQPVKLLHRIKLLGAREPYNFVILVIHPPQALLGTCHYSQYFICV